MKSRLSILLSALCALLSAGAVTLEWDPSPDADWIAGYRLYYSPERVATHGLTNNVTMVDCGPFTQRTIANTNFPERVRFWFVATAYYDDGTNIVESEPSNEVTWMNWGTNAGRVRITAQPVRANTVRTR